MNYHKNTDENELEDQNHFEYPKLRIRWTLRYGAFNLGFSGEFVYRCRWVLRHEFDDVAVYLKTNYAPSHNLYEEEILKAITDFNIIKEIVISSASEITKRRFFSGVEKTSKYIDGVIKYTIYDFATGKEFDGDLSNEEVGKQHSPTSNVTKEKIFALFGLKPWGN